MFEVASSDLVNMGITVVSYTIKDIRDEEVRIICYLIFCYLVKKVYKLKEKKIVVELFICPFKMLPLVFGVITTLCVSCGWYDHVII